MLILLDNARDAEQVRPLLAGGASALVLVTSRNQLSGLVAVQGAHPIRLDLLTRGESRRLLAGRLGAERVAAEPEAVDQIVAGCARLPLALAIAAARAADHPGAPLADVAEEIRRARSVLDVFAEDDAAADARAVFSWSYRLLGPDAARLFRLLSLHPGPDIGVTAAASLAGLSVAAVRPLLAQLTTAHLVAQHSPGRYTCHDLLRAYAGELTGAVDDDGDRAAATRRALDHYLHSVYRANLAMDPHLPRLPLPAPSPGVAPVDHADPVAAIGWLDTEHPVLVAAVERAAEVGHDEHAWRIPSMLGYFFDRRGHWHDWYATHVVGLAAAERSGDRTGQATVHRGLAGAYTRLGRIDEAHPHLRQAIDLFGALGDRSGEARVHQSLSYVLGQQQRYEEAKRHGELAFELYGQIGNRAAQARSLNVIGHFHTQLGDPRQGLAHCYRALELLDELGDRLSQISTWESIGQGHRSLGDHERATTSYRRGLDLARDLGDRPDQAVLLTSIGDNHLAAGEVDAARDAWQEALGIFEELNDPHTDEVRAKLDGLGAPRDQRTAGRANTY